MMTERFLGPLRSRLGIALFFIVIVAGQVAPTLAATITVNTDSDELNSDGDCSLREAVAAANRNAAVDGCVAGSADGDTIGFSANYRISLNPELGQLVVLDTPLTINGPASINGNGGTRIFLIGNSEVNDTDARALTLNNLIVENGRPDIEIEASSISGGNLNTNGGCIFARPYTSLTLSATMVRGCQGTNGGGIFADEGSTVTIHNSSLIGANLATINGGGLAMTTGYLTVDGDSTFEGNRANSLGGGIFVGDTVVVTFGGGSSTNRAFLIGNNANGGGGGMYMDVNATFIGNHARFFNNSTSSTGIGSAWFSQGGSSASNGEDVGRSCVDCCIVNNNSQYAVYQEVNGLIAQWQDNWWGNDWGPRIYDLDPTQSESTISSSVSNGDGISGDGALAVVVGLTDDGEWETQIPTGAWLTTTAGDIPSDCLNDTCTTTNLQSIYTPRVCTTRKD